MKRRIAQHVLTLTITVASVAAVAAADWPQWGGGPARNMVSVEKNLPATFEVGEMDYDTELYDMAQTKHVRWITKLGSQAYGNPVVVDGRVYLGTNNASPLDPKFKGDRSNVYCLDEKTGELVWQLSVPKLGAGKVGDWEFLGICSGPAVADGVVYVVTNRCEVVALDVDGMADGNDGPFKDEAKYFAGDPTKPPIEPGATDGDILWRYDLAGELGVFPHNVTSNSPLIVGDHLAIGTSNGVDYSHSNIPNERAPAMVVLNRKTGALVAEEASGISGRTLHANWSSPAYAKVGEREMFIFGAGDGFTYGFDVKPVEDEDGYMVLRELWRVDCNPAEYWKDKDGKPIRYAKYAGPSECIGTPVVYNNRVYIAIGQDPEHGEGVGALTCIDPATGGIVWQSKEIGRTISTVSVHEGLVYAAEYAGALHCFDAATGKRYWTHDTEGHIWGSTLVADGKVYLGNEDGYVHVLATGKEKKVLSKVEIGTPVYGTPVAANGTLYIMTQTHLFALSEKE